MNKIEINSKIYPSFIESSLVLPILISSDDGRVTIQNFGTKFYTDYFARYSLAQEIIYEQTLHPTKVCLSCATVLSAAYRLNVAINEIQDLDDYVLVYSISENGSSSDFLFASKF